MLFRVLYVGMLWLAGCSATVQAHTRCAAEVGSRSINGRHTTEVVFVNKRAQTITIWWLDYKGKRVQYNTLASGDHYTQQTYVTHPWVVTDTQGQCLGLFFPDAQRRTIDVQ
jgi:hypothetical protein